jgi:hypothetical protein
LASWETKARFALDAPTDARLGVVDAQEMLRSKEKEIGRLGEALAFRDKQTVERYEYSYRMKDGEPTGHPYCPICEANAYSMLPLRQKVAKPPL